MTAAVYYYEDDQVLEKKRWDVEKPPSKARWYILGGVLALLLVCLAILYFVYLPERNAQRASVLITVDTRELGKSRQGSGVFISPKGYVLTNRHVVISENGEAAGKIYVHYLSGAVERQVMEATVVKKGETGDNSEAQRFQGDWCVLRVTSKDPVPYVELADKSDFREEESLKAYGFPRADQTATNSYGPQVKVLHGIINRVDRSSEGGVIRLTHSASTAEGMSGGGLLQGGRLIGLNTAVLTGGKVTANENYAIPVYLLKESVFSQYGPGK